MRSYHKYKTEIWGLCIIALMTFYYFDRTRQHYEGEKISSIERTNNLKKLENFINRER